MPRRSAGFSVTGSSELDDMAMIGAQTAEMVVVLVIVLVTVGGIRVSK